MGVGNWGMVYAEAAAKGKVFGNANQIVCVFVQKSAYVGPASKVTGSFKKCLVSEELNFLLLLLTHTHTHRIYTCYTLIGSSIAHSGEIETDIAVTGLYQHI